jgi:hypothetical protein
VRPGGNAVRAPSEAEISRRADCLTDHRGGAGSASALVLKIECQTPVLMGIPGY